MSSYEGFDDDERDTTAETWPLDEHGVGLPGLNGETLHPFDGWYCIAWPVRGEWVVSDQAGWLPGSYPTREAAIEAARVANGPAESGEAER